MLSGEGMQRRKTGEKQQQVLSKNNFFCTFLCRCFARLQRETSRNFLVTRFMEEMLYVFPFTFFHCRSFSPCIGGRQHFSFCHRHYTKFSCCSSNKKNVSFGFSSLALNPCRPFSRENLSQFNTLDNTDTETIFAFRFRLYQGHLYEEK